MGQDPVNFVLSSDFRLKILAKLHGSPSTPTSIAAWYSKHTSHASRALHELKTRNLVVCVTPESRKERYYSLTHEGERVLNEIRRIRMVF